jgi:hypothetical protein
MKLTLEEIWKMADLLEEAQKITVKSKSGLQEKTQKKQTQERVLKLPKLQISENWGKENQVDRKELERIVDTATRGKVNAFDKLRVIQQQMDQLTTGKLGKIKNPRRILSQIMILETMNRLFKSFQPAPAGFINEAFLSVFYGGVQTAAGEANKAKDIGDVTDPEGVPISIKTKGTGGLIVDGSVENLYSSINNTKGKKVYFDIYEKITEGAEGDKHVGVLKVVRFVVDANNINQFLGKEYFNIVDGKLVPKAAFKKGGKDVEIQNEARPKKQKPPSAEEILNLTLQKTFSEEEMDDLTDHLGPRITSQMIAKMKEMRTTVTPEQKVNLDKNISALSGVIISRRDVEKASGGLEREFHIPETRWRAFADQQGFIDEIVLTFSDKQINVMLQAAVEALDEGIVEIFNTLDGFSQSINTYLTSISSNRTADGFKALEYAKRLEPQTQQVVKTTAGED